MVSSKAALGVVAILLGIDQATKLWAKTSDVNTSVFNYLQNSGAALGILPGINDALIVITVFAALLLITAVVKFECPDRCMYALVLAGVLGNGIDRIIFGAVTDFIRFFGVFVFNLADLYITVGVIGLLLLEIPWIRRYF